MPKSFYSWMNDSQDEALKYESPDRVEISAHVLIERESDGSYTAHCLEFDIVSEADSLKEVQEDIIDAIIAHVTFCFQFGNEDKILKPAPPEYWNRYFMRSKRIGNRKLPTSTQFPNIQSLVKEVSFNESMACV